MKILALDSSGLVASAAVVEDNVLIAEYTTDYKKTHSQTLLPMLDEIRQMIALDLHTIDAIAISAGPGSFTGLRIGAATAKRTWSGTESAVGRGADTGKDLHLIFGDGQAGLPHYGCQKESGIHRDL